MKIPKHINIKDSFGFYNKIRDIQEDQYWFDDIDFPEEAINEEIENIKSNYSEEELEHMDIMELKVEARDSLLEGLSFWIIYFEPEEAWTDEGKKGDIEIALKCGLIPFYYKDIFLLALGGCGMDLSPKLDAYQVLTSDTIDRNSSLFRQPDYFKYVVGEKVYQEVLERLGIKESDLK